MQDSFNAAISKLIRVRGAEKFSDKCTILMVWFGWAIFRTYWRISQPHEIRLTYRSMCWNRLAKTVLLDVITSKFDNIHFLPKGEANEYLIAFSMIKMISKWSQNLDICLKHTNKWYLPLQKLKSWIHIFWPLTTTV